MSEEESRKSFGASARFHSVVSAVGNAVGIDSPQHHSLLIDDNNLGGIVPSGNITDEQRTLSFSVRKGVVLKWSNVTVRSKDGSKVLLKGVSGAVKGHMLAIMGPSGCGKTTLMNVLACRQSGVKYEGGDTTLNGQEYSGKHIKKIGGYVMQDDLLNGFLTCQETLEYTARLRLKDVTEEERMEKINDVMQKVGIEKCKNTRVGDSLHKGISGGERKRLCVAMELLTSPQVLFLDEPTSGLDSVTALSLLITLSELTRSFGCTIICTIHQPQNKIFELFDDILLLCRGVILYHGPRIEVLDHFASHGFPCPPNTNPADHLIDIAVHVERDPELTEKLAIKEPIQRDYHRTDVRDIPLPIDWTNIPWYQQYYTLLHRSIREQLRNRFAMITLYIQICIAAVLIGSVFFQLGNEQVSISLRRAVLFFCAVNQGIFAAEQSISSFPSERQLVLRERAAGMYKVSAYYMAKMTAELFSNIFPPLVFSAIVYPMIGLQSSVSKWFIFASFLILCSICAQSLAIMVATICRTTTLSVTILPMALEITRLFGGFFLPPARLPNYFVWLDHLSYLRYTYNALSLNEWTGLKLVCTPAELAKAAGKCPRTDGMQEIKALGLDQMTIGECAGILLALIVGFRFIGFLGLRFLKS